MVSIEIYIMPSMPHWRDKPLFTPGPLTTSRTVKEAMLRDLGSRDYSFIEQVRHIRERLVALAGGDEETYTAIPMQGSGTFGLEAAAGSLVPDSGRLLVCVNGAYGARLVRMAEILKIDVAALRFPENEAVNPQAVEDALAADGGITHVAACHCENDFGHLESRGGNRRSGARARAPLSGRCHEQLWRHPVVASGGRN